MENQIEPSQQNINDTGDTDKLFLLIFIPISLIVIIIVLLKSELNFYQQFHIRILMALASAGIATTIPGAFEMGFRLKVSLRVTGAIAVFVLVYTTNPPEQKRFETLRQLEGNWYYDVHPSTQSLGFGAQHYGGVTNFQTEQGHFGECLSLTGTIEWKIVNDTFSPFPPFANWQSISGAVTADDKLIYNYQAIDGGRLITGFCNYNIVRDLDNQIIELDGNFFRIDSPFVKGTIYMRRTMPFYNKNRQLFYNLPDDSLIKKPFSYKKKWF